MEITAVASGTITASPGRILSLVLVRDARHVLRHFDKPGRVVTLLTEADQDLVVGRIRERLLARHNPAITPRWMTHRYPPIVGIQVQDQILDRNDFKESDLPGGIRILIL